MSLKMSKGAFAANAMAFFGLGRRLKRAHEQIKRNNERDARVSLIEDLFYDFHRNRHQVYWMNFVRGIFFGLGSVIGGTIVLALIIWLFSQIITLFPFHDDVINTINTTIDNRPR